MRENRTYGSEGGEPHISAAFLPLSLPPLRGLNDCRAVPIPRAILVLIRHISRNWPRSRFVYSCNRRF